VLEILKKEFPTGPAAVFHEFLQSGKRGFVQERRISRRAMLRIVSPADDEASDTDASAQRDAA
jgi:hypothetical protein